MLVAMVSLQPLAFKDKLEGSVWCSLSLLGCLVVSVDSARSFGYCEMLWSSRPNLFEDDEETRQLIEKAKATSSQDKKNAVASVVLANLKVESNPIRNARRSMLLYVISLISLLFVSVIAPLFIEPSDKLPDIIPVMNSMVCCAHFVWYWMFWTRHLMIHEY